MLDKLRRLLAAGMLTAAIIGFLPLIPTAFGFRSAAVTNDTAGTFYPATVSVTSGTPAPLVFCEQAAVDGVGNRYLNLTKNKNYVGQYWFRCTNNWGSDVSVTLSILNDGGSGLLMSAATGTVPAGTTRCIKSTLKTPNNGAANILYQAAVSGADLTATLQFAGYFVLAGTDSTQCVGTPAP